MLRRSTLTAGVGLTRAIIETGEYGLNESGIPSPSRSAELMSSSNERIWRNSSEPISTGTARGSV